MLTLFKQSCIVSGCRNTGPIICTDKLTLKKCLEKIGKKFVEPITAYTSDGYKFLFPREYSHGHFIYYLENKLFSQEEKVSLILKAEKWIGNIKKIDQKIIGGFGGDSSDGFYTGHIRGLDSIGIYFEQTNSDASSYPICYKFKFPDCEELLGLYFLSSSFDIVIGYYKLHYHGN